MARFPIKCSKCGGETEVTTAKLKRLTGKTPLICGACGNAIKAEDAQEQMVELATKQALPELEARIARPPRG